MIRIIDWLFVDEQTKVDEIIRVLLEINFKKGIFSYWKESFHIQVQFSLNVNRVKIKKWKF